MLIIYNLLQIINKVKITQQGQGKAESVINDKNKHEYKILRNRLEDTTKQESLIPIRLKKKNTYKFCMVLLVVGCHCVIFIP